MTTTDIPIANLVVDPTNPRTDPGDIDELAASIADIGLQRPLLVRPLEGDIYGVVAGQRRLAALQTLGRDTATCEIRHLDDTAAAVAGAVDHMAARTLNPIDEANAYRDLLARTGLTQYELARQAGVSQPKLAQRLKLLELPEDIQAQVADGTMSIAAAYRMARKVRGALERPRKRRHDITADDVDALDVVAVDSMLARHVKHAARQRSEHPTDLIARAIRRELATPSCVRCERRPALTAIGRGTSCGPGCPGKDPL